MKSLFFIEVVYNRLGQLQDPDSPVRRSLTYHTLFIPVWADSLEESDAKVRSWFEVNKPEYKIIKIINHKALE